MNILSNRTTSILGTTQISTEMNATQFAKAQADAFELRRKALARLTADVQWLIDMPPNSIKWKSTRRDLVEMIDLTWMQNACIDRQGRPYTRRKLARQAFAVVGQSMPHCLERVVSQIRERMSPELSILYRYQQLIDKPDIILRFCEPKTKTSLTFNK